MNVIFIFNYYTSFKNIIKKKKLIETGNISLINIIKKVSYYNKTSVILLDKNPIKKQNHIDHIIINDINFFIVPYKLSFKKNNFLLFFYSNLFIFKKFLFLNKSTFYIDRGNIWLAYLIKLTSRHNVVLRVLGITKQIEILANGKSIKSFLYKIFWMKKYDLVIHSNDGSNFKLFNNKYLNPQNNMITLNQAVKKLNFEKNVYNYKFKILLCDNFESEYKNLKEILNSITKIESNLKKKLMLYIICSNDFQKNKIKSKLVSFKNIIFMKRINYFSLLKLKSDCDALITYNSMGYLSNNIVESIFYKNWIITPDYPKIKKNIPSKFIKNFIFLKRDNLKISLNNKLRELIIKKRTNIIKFKNVTNVDEKINRELNILERLKLIN